MFWIDSVVWLGKPVGGKEWLEDSSLFSCLTSERQCQNNGIWFCIVFNQPTELTWTREKRDLQEELQLDLGESSFRVGLGNEAL